MEHGGQIAQGKHHIALKEPDVQARMLHPQLQPHKESHAAQACRQQPKPPLPMSRLRQAPQQKGCRRHVAQTAPDINTCPPVTIPLMPDTAHKPDADQHYRPGYHKDAAPAHQLAEKAAHHRSQGKPAVG